MREETEEIIEFPKSKKLAFKKDLIIKEIIKDLQDPEKPNRTYREISKLPHINSSRAYVGNVVKRAKEKGKLPNKKLGGIYPPPVGMTEEEED